MSTIRSSALQTLARPVQLAVRPITLLVAAVLVAAIVALAVALAAGSSGGDTPPAVTKSVRVTPSTGIPPSPAERNLQPGQLSSGARP